MKTLTELKCGDLVVLFNCFAVDCSAPHVVQKVTKAKITVEGRNFRRSDGLEMNSRIVLDKRFRIEPYDEYEWEKSLNVASYNLEIMKQPIAGVGKSDHLKYLESVQILIDKNEKQKEELRTRQSLA